MTDPGTAFPPRDVWDVAAYNTDDVVAGYRGHRLSDAAPGNNHAPGYRWGWSNARHDRTGIEDGFSPLRFEYIQLAKRAH